MQKQISNPCTRCGSERIVSKTWEETIATFSGTMVVVHSLTVCPNPECQKITDGQLAAQRTKQEAIRSNQEAKAADRKKKGEEKKRSARDAQRKCA